MRNKDEVIKNLERRLLNAKSVIAELRAEVRRRDQPTPQENAEDPPASQQQHQQTAYINIRVSTHSLANIHERYDQVLQTMKENRCSMACAFRLASCPRSTLRDFVGIAELKKVNSRKLDLVLRDQGVTSVRDLEVVCRKRLQRYIPVMSNMRREGQLLPMKFEARFYEWSILLIFHHSKNGSFRSHHIYESQWPTIKFKLSNKYISLLFFLSFFFFPGSSSKIKYKSKWKLIQLNLWKTK